MNKNGIRLLTCHNLFFSRHIQEKITHMLFVDDLKTFRKSMSKAILIAGKIKDMFEDMGLQWGLDKCEGVNIQ